MQFKREMADKANAGLKTQTRRLKHEGEYALPRKNGGILCVYSANQRLKWEVGRSYSIQPGRGKKATGRFTLLAIRETRSAWEISEEDAIAEGFDNRLEFVRYFTMINGESALKKPLWALTFKKE